MQSDDSPNISVIMNCLNCSKYLREAIDSVYAQTYKDWEIIFWDNASTDHSAEIAKSYDEKLRYFRGKKTVPVGKARNLAIEKSKGEYIAFLDCDDIWLPRKLEKQLPLFDKPEVGLTFSDTFYFNENGKISQLYKNKKPPHGNIFKYMLTSYCLSMETVIIRRDALLSLHEWFDERFSMIEEADLFRRIAHDWEIDYFDEPLSKWRIHSQNLSLTIHNDLFPKETELMIDKFCSLYDGFEYKFKKELHFLKGQIEYVYGLNAWEKKKDKELRDRLKPYLFTNKKYFIPFIMSFVFSYSFFCRMQIFWTGYFNR